MAVKTRRTRSTKLRTILLPLLNQPPTFPLSTSSTDRARAPHPDVFLLSQERIPYDAPPSVAEAALHLLLLEVFWQLFRRLDSEAEQNKDTEHGESLRTRYLLNAVQRFEAWWTAVAKEVQREYEADMKTESENADTGEFVKTRPLRPHHQPPLDVMLVWHTYLLNPGWYEKDCRRIHGEGMLTVGFPWEMIVSVVQI